MALPAVARDCLSYPFYASRAELAALARALRSSHDTKQKLCVSACIWTCLHVFTRICTYVRVPARICVYLRVFASMCPHTHVVCQTKVSSVSTYPVEETVALGGTFTHAAASLLVVVVGVVRMRLGLR